ncbi:MAG: hypothetical protein GY835_22095, partial [bacterium]|nr:hypothetical protein [bacterium]
MYKQNRTVATGSIAHSLSKNQLEDINRGLTSEIPDRSDDGYSTDYDSEGDEGMELILASMPPLPAQSLVPPTTDSGAGEDEFQPPDPFPSAKEVSPSPLAFGAGQAREWLQLAEEVLSSDEEPPGLMSSSDDEPPGVEPVLLVAEAEELPKMKVVLPPEAGMRPPHIEMLLHSTGLLSLSMA